MLQFHSNIKYMLKWLSQKDDSKNPLQKSQQILQGFGLIWFDLDYS